MRLHICVCWKPLFLQPQQIPSSSFPFAFTHPQKHTNTHMTKAIFSLISPFLALPLTLKVLVTDVKLMGMDGGLQKVIRFTIVKSIYLFISLSIKHQQHPPQMRKHVNAHLSTNGDPHSIFLLTNILHIIQQQLFLSSFSPSLLPPSSTILSTHPPLSIHNSSAT